MSTTYLFQNEMFCCFCSFSHSEKDGATKPGRVDRHRGSGHPPTRDLFERVRKRRAVTRWVNLSGGFSAFDFGRFALGGAAGGSVIVVSA
jgi:hypothetical protein